MIKATIITVGTLRYEFGDTSENVTGKLASCPAFKIFGFFPTRLFSVLIRYNKIKLVALSFTFSRTL